MSVTTSTSVSSATLPTAPSDLWAMGEIFLASWAEGIEMSTSYQTDISLASSQTEARSGLATRPHRIIHASLKTMNKPDVTKLLSMMARMGTSRTLFPLYQDFTKISIANVSTDTVLTCTTANRRFFNGMWVAIMVPFGSFEITKISSFNATTITLTTGLANGYAINSRVYPLIEVDCNVDQSISVDTDLYLRYSVELKETPGTSALDPLYGPNTIPSGVSTYNSLPIWDAINDWSSVKAGYRRGGKIVNIGIGTYMDLAGEQPMHTLNMPAKFMKRADVFQRLAFFDSRCGSLYPFFVMLPFNQLQYLSNTTSTIVLIEPISPILWDQITYVGMLSRAHGFVFAQISSTSRALVSGVYHTTINTVETTLPVLSVADVRRMAPVILARFSTDEITERWVDNFKSTLQVTMQEVDDQIIDVTVPAVIVGSGASACAPDYGGPLPDPYSPPTYVQLYACTSGKVSGLWVPTASLPVDWTSTQYTLLFNGWCFYVPIAETPSTTPERVIPGWEILTDCADALCADPEYVQYNKCTDGTAADVWLLNYLAPECILLSGACYSKSVTTSTSPGTVAVGYTIAPGGCDDPICPATSNCLGCVITTPSGISVSTTITHLDTTAQTETSSGLMSNFGSGVYANGGEEYNFTVTMGLMGTYTFSFKLFCPDTSYTGLVANKWQWIATLAMIGGPYAGKYFDFGAFMDAVPVNGQVTAALTCTGGKVIGTITYTGSTGNTAGGGSGSFTLTLA